MDKAEHLAKQLKAFKKEVSKKIPLKALVFFGSRAKGKGKKYSDIDLLVVSSKFKNKKFHQRATALYDYWTLDYPVDFLCYTPEEFNKNKKMIGIVRRAVEEGIKI
ncbi:MAG TPA: nucleotidyltransferase domain-containing protein [Candidatus Nanoarchaeia archaeon]|nr:nucleotidyltransferase domain-containing protein [Candidatus Nanoarchaeia archaeon]